MRLLKRTDVVRAVAGHERSVPKGLECGEDVLLLRGRDAGVDKGVLHKGIPGSCVGEGGVPGHGGTGNTDIVCVKEVGRKRLSGVDGDDGVFVDSAPYKI